MSGGELEYLYGTIRNCLELNFKATTPHRAAFLEHMQLVIQALHDIEWVDSGDFAKGEDEESIMRVLQDESSLVTLIELKTKGEK